jgi:hypothetical protein
MNKMFEFAMHVPMICHNVIITMDNKKEFGGGVISYRQ